jgi:hypothetical protein
VALYQLSYRPSTPILGRARTGTVVHVHGVGTLDEAGRLRLLGAAVTGAAFAVVLVVLVVSSWAGSTPAVVLTVGIPSALVGAGAGVVMQQRSWRAEGGYAQSVEVRDWIAANRVPADVPATTWIPLVQAQADREGAGWGKIVLCTLWTAMTWSMRDQHGTVLTLMLVTLWVALGTWSAVWVIPHARRARALLRQGVSTPS